MKQFLILTLLSLVAGCAMPFDLVPPTAVPDDPALEARADAAARQFVDVVERVEPVAEALCRDETPDINCDFRILVDANPNAPANAFQTQDRRGRPVIVFTVGLIADAHNADELAFILGHEAAHHLAGHIARSEETAQAGAVVFGKLATAQGLSPAELERAASLGALIGARIYAKEYELEADQLGTVIAARAGFDPIRGAAFFTRIPDPEDTFLGTHPPNAQRLEIVRRTAASL